MSYILDALRKAEQKRKLENIPELESTVLQGNAKRKNLPWGRIAGFLFLLAAVMALILFRQPLLESGRVWVAGLSKPDEAAKGERTERDGAGIVEKGGGADRLGERPEIPRAKEIVVPAIPPVQQGPAGERKAKAAGADPQPERAATRERIAPDPQPAGNGRLPAALQQQLDGIDLTVISYSTDPVKRFIMVGADILREGDRLPGGILIGQIRRRDVLVEVDGREAVISP